MWILVIVGFVLVCLVSTIVMIVGVGLFKKDDDDIT